MGTDSDANATVVLKHSPFQTVTGHDLTRLICKEKDLSLPAYSRSRDLKIPLISGGPRRESPPLPTGHRS